MPAAASCEQEYHFGLLVRRQVGGIMFLPWRDIQSRAKSCGFRIIQMPIPNTDKREANKQLTSHQTGSLLWQPQRLFHLLTYSASLIRHSCHKAPRPSEAGPLFVEVNPRISGCRFHLSCILEKPSYYTCVLQ